MKKQLHPGAKWLFRVRGFFGGLVFLWIFGWFLFSFLAIIFKQGASVSPVTFFGSITSLIIVYLIIIVIIAEIYARMSYTRWFYEFSEDNLKLERGIIWKRYSNVPYERVQNVDIRRGIIARLSGFSEVYIQTAGYGAAPKGGAFAEGYIPAMNIEEAEHIRDFLMKKISKRGRRQGL